jgi:hypothetical protein
VSKQAYNSKCVDFSFLGNPEVIKLSAAVLGLGASVFTVIDKLLSRRKPPHTVTFCFPNLQFFGAPSIASQSALFKKNE